MRTAIVVGAGVAGLATAGALARSGWSVTLLEREERLVPGRAALILWPNGVRALRALGLAGGLDSVATRVGPRGVRGPDGRWLLPPERVPDVAEDPPVVLRREDLHDALIAGLGDQVDVRTGVRVLSVPSTAGRPAVSDGAGTYEADLVVGADGARSVLRSRLAGESTLVTVGRTAWQAIIPWYRARRPPEDAPVSCETIGVGHAFGYVPIGTPSGPSGTAREEVYWTATAPGAPRPEPPEAQLGLLRRWFAGWPAPTAELLAATAPEDLVQHGVAEVRPLPSSLVFPKGMGGYALVGDAGHAMAHYLGQGACLALEDAVTLRSVVRGAAPGAALRSALVEYSRSRRPRLSKIAGRTRLAGAMWGGQAGFSARARAFVARRSLPGLLDRANPEVCDWNPPKE